MGKKYFLITGTSRGIGEELAHQLIAPENVVICLSRNRNPRLHIVAEARKGRVDDFAIDLNDLAGLRQLLPSVFRLIRREDADFVALVNNAGVVQPVRRLGGKDASEKIIRSINVNLTAAFFLTDFFIRETRSWTCEKRILNLTTGAARRPVSGWSTYCASKAGLDMLTRCTAEEQLTEPHPVKIVAFTPGVVDTEMQAEVRSAGKDEFAELEKFQAYKEEGKLLSPVMVAEKIRQLLDDPGFGTETFLDIRTM